MLDFPALGSTKEVALGDGQLAEIRITARLVGAGEARKWALRIAKIRQDDLLRVSELRKKTTREVTPELWDVQHLSDAASEEMSQHYRSILERGLISVSGFSVGGVDISDVKDIKELINKLEYVGLMDVAVLKVMEVQSPRIEQLLSSAS